jgi:hypothetical protein
MMGAYAHMEKKIQNIQAPIYPGGYYPAAPIYGWREMMMEQGMAEPHSPLFPR